MATEFDTETAAPNKPAAKPAEQPRAPMSAKPAVNNRYLDRRGLDDVDHQILSHRAHLEALDSQILSLDNTIALEQHKFRESKTSLHHSQIARERLLHLREAMLNFVMELEVRGEE